MLGGGARGGRPGVLRISGLLPPTRPISYPNTQPHPNIIRRQTLGVVRGPSSPVSCQLPVVAAALSLLQCHVRMLPQWRQRDRCAPDASNRCMLPRARHSGVGRRPPLASASLLLSSLLARMGPDFSPFLCLDMSPRKMMQALSAPKSGACRDRDSPSLYLIKA